MGFCWQSTAHEQADFSWTSTIPETLSLEVHLFTIDPRNGKAVNMSDKKQTVDLGLLEEDDEFEEFPAEGKLILVQYVTNVNPFSLNCLI